MSQDEQLTLREIWGARMTRKWLRSEGMVSPMKRTTAVSLALTAIILVGGCKQEEKTAVVKSQAVQVMRIAPASESEAWSYVGTLRARFESDIAFRVGGKITRRLVDIGASVAAGQIIAELDPTDYRLALEAQQAELAAAKSSRDQAVAAEGRYRLLNAHGHVAKAALDQRVAAADEARGRVERAERALALARNQLDYAVLRSDAAGVVSALSVEVGQVVGAGQPIARIARRDQIEALVAIPEHRLADVKKAQAEIEIWGDGNRRYPAKLREVAPEADRVSRTYGARFSVDVGGNTGELGRTATVHLRAANEVQAFAVPLAAVMQDATTPTIWVLDETGTRVRRTPVTLLRLTRDAAIITGTLKSGDRIVALGVHMLDADRPVRVFEQRADLQ
jgi:RND family efflux transporter MFP subunit